MTSRPAHRLCTAGNPVGRCAMVAEHAEGKKASGPTARLINEAISIFINKELQRTRVFVHQWRTVSSLKFAGVDEPPRVSVCVSVKVGEVERRRSSTGNQDGRR